MEVAVSPAPSFAEGQGGVRVVLLRRVADDVGVGGHIAQGVKVPHHQVRVHPMGLHLAKTSVSGNAQIPRLDVRPLFPVFPRGKNITNGHGSLLVSHS